MRLRFDDLLNVLIHYLNSQKVLFLRQSFTKLGLRFDDLLDVFNSFNYFLFSNLLFFSFVLGTILHQIRVRV
jgi:hypothetical protein